MIETVFVAFAFSWFVSWIKGTEWYGFDIFKHWSIYPIILTCFLSFLPASQQLFELLALLVADTYQVNS